MRMERFIIVLLLIPHATSNSEQNTVIDVASRNGATTLGRLLNGTTLEKRLLNDGNFTLFAPVDDGFSWLPPSVLDTLNKNKTFVDYVFTSHVIPDRVGSDNFTNDVIFPSLNSVIKIRINIIESKATADGVDITVTDLPASNGVVHMLQRVMYPFPTQSILEYLTTTQTLSLLVDVIRHANLTEYFKGEPFTLFAPTNEAFAKLPDGFLQKLMSNKTGLIDLVEYHVLTETLFSEGLYDNERLITANNKQLIVTVMEGNVVINGALLKVFDVILTNGVIQIIDRVLLPPN
ncbi:periostin-like [Pecten maximus]|uniref:periostin-like n=1 Tax=Pecten maximus TaxID=6579 RepID=UPI001458BB84|nr:periostin-like [Pecten maximus]